MEVKVLEVSDINLIAIMVKEHAIVMIAAILSVSYHDAENIYTLLFG